MTEPDTVDPSLHARDLLRSLQVSILRLRNEAEDLRARLEQFGAEALEQGEKQQVVKLDSLIRDCQKVEKTLAEQTHNTSSGGVQLNLEEARIEIGCRLDRLRATANSTAPSGDIE